MIGFVVLTLLLALGGAAFVALPLLRARGDAPAASRLALTLVAVFVLATLGLYSLVGNRDWDKPAASAGTAISTLVRRVDAAPEDVAGWIALGQAYTANQEYALAIRAYSRANRLTDNSNATALSGLAEALTLGGDSSQAARAQELFERALQLDARSPKALFYSAVAAFRDGRLPLARERFAAMLALQPPENIRVALQKEIDSIDSQLHPTVDPATAIRLHVTLAPALAAKVPADASLFVFVRAPEGGAPLAVKRGAAQLPQDVDLSASDAMIAGRSVHAGQKVTVAARISASGSPLAQTGDLYGEIEYRAGKDSVRDIVIDKLQP